MRRAFRVFGLGRRVNPYLCPGPGSNMSAELAEEIAARDAEDVIEQADGGPGLRSGRFRSGLGVSWFLQLRPSFYGFWGLRLLRVSGGFFGL